MKTSFVSSLFLSTVMCFSLSAQQSTPSAADQGSSSAQSSQDVNQANQNQANQNSASQPSTSSTTDQSSPSSQQMSDQNSATQDSTNQNPSSGSQNPASSQNPANQNANEQGNQGQVPTYRVTVVERSTEAVDYRDRGGTTQVDFKGTTLAPRVTGLAKVTGHTGRLAIDANV